MKLTVRLRDMDDAAGLKELVEKKISFAIDRISPKIDELSVVVSDTNGPRGGVDKRCSIRGVLGGGQPVSVDEQGADARSAVNCAVKSLRVSILRRMSRSRRGRPSAAKLSSLDAIAL